MQFKLKDYFVDAVQWFKNGDHPLVVSRTPIDGTPENSVSVLPTKSGDIMVNRDDYVVTHPNGDIEVQTPENFSKSFESVESNAQKEIARLQTEAAGQTLHFTGMI